MIPGLVGLLIYSQKHCPATEGYNKGAALSWSLGTAAFGGLFIIIDSGGKGFELVPKELEVRLKKAEGPRKIDTILVDPDDFRNIKWIRVHRDGAPADPATPWPHLRNRHNLDESLSREPNIP
jgi:hypothetical protein